MSESAQKQSEPKHSSIEDDWQKLKIQNQLMDTQQAKQEAQSSLQQQDLPLPVNENGTLNFFWIDAHEEAQGAEIYLFGKIW